MFSKSHSSSLNTFEKNSFFKYFFYLMITDTMYMFHLEKHVVVHMY